jgi:2'-hydroxyisoflavone reductase
VELLLLGGYRFLGRAIITAAQARGHHVTAFNRGNLAPLPGVAEIRGDRDDPAPLASGRWDAVIDTSGYVPRHVRVAAEVLRERVERYVFVSSLSAYADPMAAGCDESAPLKTLPDGTDPDGPYRPELYGELKVLCEEAAETAMPERSVAVRAGFIVGPYDNTDRFNSWIERAARDEPMLVPGEPDAPLQMIDVRDLAAWIVGAAEQRLSGAFNLTAPATPFTALEVAQACIAGTGSTAIPFVVSSEVAQRAGVIPWEHIPFWFEPDQYGMMQMNIDRALATGLTLRPLVETVADTYAWLRMSDHARLIGCPPAFERAAIQFQLRG